VNLPFPAQAADVSPAAVSGGGGAMYNVRWCCRGGIFRLRPLSARFLLLEHWAVEERGGGGVMDAWKEQEGTKKKGVVGRRTTRRATRASLVGPLCSPVPAAPLGAVVVSDGGAG
jgi:hypothetical protein